MTTTRAHTLRLVLATACGLPVCLLQAAPAQAEPVFVGAATSLSIEVMGEVAGPGCGSSESTTGSQVPVVENGGTAALANDVALTGSYNAVQIAAGSESVTARAGVTSAGGMPSTLDLTASGQGQLTFSQGGSGCTLGGGGEYHLNFQFVLTSPAYLDLGATITGRGNADLELHAVSGSAAQFNRGFVMGYEGTETARLLLPAATYAGRLTAGASVRGTASASASGSASLHGAFTPLGAQLTAPAGKGGRYVTLPSAATCANGTLAPSVTTSKKRAAHVRTVAFQVGTAKQKLHTPKKGQAVSLPFAGSQPGTLTATVTLRPHHGRKPKVLTVSATYQACS